MFYFADWGVRQQIHNGKYYRNGGKPCLKGQMCNWNVVLFYCCILSCDVILQSGDQTLYIFACYWMKCKHGALDVILLFKREIVTGCCTLFSLVETFKISSQPAWMRGCGYDDTIELTTDHNIMVSYASRQYLIDRRQHHFFQRYPSIFIRQTTTPLLSTLDPFPI